VFFAPIIDIDRNFRNPITNTRTFGSDPEMVKRCGEAYVKAVQAEGVAACIKHFPGDGCDERDQHLVTTVNDLSCEDWMAAYGAAYKAGIEAGSLTAMVGHIMQPAWSRRLSAQYHLNLRDEDMLPASLSRELLQGLLRGVLGFNGLICSDASVMAGFCIPMERRRAVPACIAAGCDMFLFTRNMDEDIHFMEDGVENGTLSAERHRMGISLREQCANLPQFRTDHFHQSGKSLPSAGRAANEDTSQQAARYLRWRGNYCSGRGTYPDRPNQNIHQYLRRVGCGAGQPC
jgi:beta-N-acetylhexosaminidase